MATFLLVPGACHGGWWYDPVVAALRARGHVAVAVTLGGLGEEPLAALPPVTLASHLDEALAAVPAGDDLILVGHSYGGCVITGVADRIADRVRALVYLDAFVPGDGDSCFALTNDEQRRWYIEGAGRTGITVDPLPFFDPRARPHPLATFVQQIRLTGAWRTVPVKHYVEALDWAGGSPFAATAARVRAEPGWTVHAWQTRHNVLRECADEVVELLHAAG